MKMAGNILIAQAHAIHGDYFLLDLVVQAGLMFPNQLGIKRSITISRCAWLEIAIQRIDDLLAFAIAPVRGKFLAEMGIKLGFKGRFSQIFYERGKNAFPGPGAVSPPGWGIRCC